MKKKEIPVQILSVAKPALKAIKGEIIRLGSIAETEYFYLRPNEDIEYGYPFVYSLVDGKVKEISGIEACDIISKFL